MLFIYCIWLSFLLLCNNSRPCYWNYIRDINSGDTIIRILVFPSESSSACSNVRPCNKSKNIWMQLTSMTFHYVTFFEVFYTGKLSFNEWKKSTKSHVMPLFTWFLSKQNMFTSALHELYVQQMHMNFIWSEIR